MKLSDDRATGLKLCRPRPVCDIDSGGRSRERVEGSAPVLCRAGQGGVGRHRAARCE